MFQVKPYRCTLANEPKNPRDPKSRQKKFRPKLFSNNDSFPIKRFLVITIILTKRVIRCQFIIS
jgi:hypothetical protein